MRGAGRRPGCSCPGRWNSPRLRDRRFGELRSEVNPMASEKILVVDDEQSMTQFLGIVLRKEGYQVTTVNSGRDALEKFKAEAFDVIISDIKMPGMDGIQVLQAIKKHDANVPV